MLCNIWCVTQTVAGSTAELQELLKFWTGWAVLPQHLYVEVLPDLSFLVASTCLTTLKLPLKYRTSLGFTQVMRAAVTVHPQSMALVLSDLLNLGIVKMCSV